MSHDAHGGNDSIFKVGINLTLACFLASAVISGVYALTAPVAAKTKIEMDNKARKELVADAQDFKAIEGKKGWFEALKDGKPEVRMLPPVIAFKNKNEYSDELIQIFYGKSN